MVGGFLAQMWDLFIQFHNGLKTIAVSFEEKAALEFPSIAICDSRAFTELSTWTANAGKYNSTTLSLEGQVSLKIFISNAFSSKNDKVKDLNTYTSELLPTVYNGYCMLYEFERLYPTQAVAGNFK